MTIRPEPDRDSRYPDRYCTTCGKGFVGYLACLTDRPPRDSQFGCNMNGVMPPNPANPDWDKPLPAGCLPASDGCPNAPMNATLDDGWTTAKIDSAHNEPCIFITNSLSASEQAYVERAWYNEAHTVPPRYIGIDYGAQPGVCIWPERSFTHNDWTGVKKAVPEHWTTEPLTKTETGWTTVPIVKK